MKKARAVMAGLVMFFYAMTLLVISHPAQPALGTVSTDQALYPVWGIGGAVRITAQGLPSNVSYYVWLQKPNEATTSFTKSSFATVNGGTRTAILITISQHDPAGTYLLSLSRSAVNDTRVTRTHFGVLGTDLRSYERTKTVTIAGGGFAANSSIHLAVAAGNGSFPEFPLNITAQATGEFSFTFKLPPSATTGTFNTSITGITFDKRQTETTNSLFIVRPTTIGVRTVQEPTRELERTASVSAIYQLAYGDGSPVTTANATASIVSIGLGPTTVPLLLVNSTSGEWRATWVPPPSANLTTYHFRFNPDNLTDAYGNKGIGSPLVSQDIKVTYAKLQLNVQANHTQQRTEDSLVTISATYHNGVNVANITRADVKVTQTFGKESKLVTTLEGPQALAHLPIPINATLGNWTLSYNIQDRWGNSGSGSFTVQVLAAVPRFQLQTPLTTERTTLLNATSKVSYPDGTPMENVTLTISYGNHTFSPTLNYNSTNSVWSGSFDIVQNATLGPYDVTWAAHDPFGNGGTNNTMTLVIPARFRFFLESNNLTVTSFSNVTVPVVVRYPNGSLLTNDFGQVLGSYTNSSGGMVIVPLGYNQTGGTWQMFFLTPEEGSLTFSFSAADHFGNAGSVTDAYSLKIITPSSLITQRLVVAGVIGALIPVVIIIWAVATISKRRRKHRP